MPTDPFIREKFTRERSAAKKLAAELFRARDSVLRNVASNHNQPPIARGRQLVTHCAGSVAAIRQASQTTITIRATANGAAATRYGKQS